MHAGKFKAPGHPLNVNTRHSPIVDHSVSCGPESLNRDRVVLTWLATRDGDEGSVCWWAPGDALIVS